MLYGRFLNYFVLVYLASELYVVPQLCISGDKQDKIGVLIFVYCSLIKSGQINGETSVFQVMYMCTNRIPMFQVMIMHTDRTSIFKVLYMHSKSKHQSFK